MRSGIVFGFSPDDPCGARSCSVTGDDVALALRLVQKLNIGRLNAIFRRIENIMTLVAQPPQGRARYVFVSQKLRTRQLSKNLFKYALIHRQEVSSVLMRRLNEYGFEIGVIVKEFLMVDPCAELPENMLDSQSRSFEHRLAQHDVLTLSTFFFVFPSLKLKTAAKPPQQSTITRSPIKFLLPDRTHSTDTIRARRVSHRRDRGIRVRHEPYRQLP
jgi:hypothetical protein